MRGANTFRIHFITLAILLLSSISFGTKDPKDQCRVNAKALAGVEKNVYSFHRRTFKVRNFLADAFEIDGKKVRRVREIDPIEGDVNNAILHYSSHTNPAALEVAERLARVESRTAPWWRLPSAEEAQKLIIARELEPPTHKVRFPNGKIKDVRYVWVNDTVNAHGKKANMTVKVAFVKDIDENWTDAVHFFGVDTGNKYFWLTPDGGIGVNPPFGNGGAIKAPVHMVALMPPPE